MAGSRAQTLLRPSRDWTPLTQVGALTLSAGVITDATRLAGVEGDGATYPASRAGVWPAATNLVTNGNATTNTTAWTAAGTATLARVTDDGKFGTTCFKWTIGATPGGEGVYSDATVTGATTGRTFTISRWVKGVGGSVGKTVRLVIREVGGASGTATVAIASFTLTSDWQLCSVTGTVVANDRTVIRNDIVVGSTGTPVTTADEVKFSGVSTFESAINMPYIETDGGTASRVAGTVTAIPASVLDETQMWVMARVRVDSTQGGSGRLFSFGDSANERLEAIITSSTNRIQTVRLTGGAGATATSASGTVAVGDTAFYMSGWAAGFTYAATNGAALTSAANTSIPTLSATGAALGTQGFASFGYPGVSILWVAIGTGVPTDELSALGNSWGNNDPLPHQFPRSAQLTFLARFNGDGTAHRYAA